MTLVIRLFLFCVGGIARLFSSLAYLLKSSALIAGVVLVAIVVVMLGFFVGVLFMFLVTA